MCHAAASCSASQPNPTQPSSTQPGCLQITHFKGQRVAADIPVWNPSFDVTPATLIEGIITERGLVPRSPTNAAAFAVRAWLTAAANGAANGSAAAKEPQPSSKLATQPGFQALDCDSIKDYVAARPELARHVGAPDMKAAWKGAWRGEWAAGCCYVCAWSCLCSARGGRHQAVDGTCSAPVLALPCCAGGGRRSAGGGQWQSMAPLCLPLTHSLAFSFCCSAGGGGWQHQLCLHPGGACRLAVRQAGAAVCALRGRGLAADAGAREGGLRLAFWG